MVRNVFVFLVLSFFTSLQALQVKLELEDAVRNDQDMPTVGLGQSFRVNVIIESDERSYQEPKVPGLEVLNIHGSSRSTSISFYNGVSLVEATQTYDVSARKEGEHILGPVTVTINGQTATSNKITYHVSASSLSQQKYSRQHGGQQSTAMLIGQLHVDNERPVVGEPFVLTLELRSIGDIPQAAIEPPTFTGFSSREIEKVEQGSEISDGQRINSIKKRYVLTPQKAGTHVIGPIGIDYKVRRQMRRGRSGFFDDGFFADFLGNAVERRHANSNQLTLIVEEVPVGSENVDAVGDFISFTASVDRKKVQLGEPFTLSLQIVGTGNLDQIVVPSLVMPDHVRFYESKVLVDHDDRSGLTAGTKRFDFIVQAHEPGKLKIPPQKFTFFDTKNRVMRTLKTETIKVAITAPKGEGSPVAPLPSSSKAKAQSEKVDNEDIHFIVQERVAPTYSGGIGWWWFILIFLLIPIGFYWRSFKERIARLVQRLLGVAWIRKSIISGLQKNLDKIKHQKNYTALYQFFLTTIAALSGIDINAINETTVEHYLETAGWPRDRINEFLLYLADCASLAFASGVGGRANNKEKLMEKAQYWFLLLSDEK